MYTKLKPYDYSCIVGLIFVILKFAGVIDWSWWLVTLPFWIGPAIGAICLLMFFSAVALWILMTVPYIIIELCKNYEQRKR